jgi:hypothetical protein
MPSFSRHEASSISAPNGAKSMPQWMIEHFGFSLHRFPKSAVSASAEQPTTCVEKARAKGRLTAKLMQFNILVSLSPVFRSVPCE